MSNNKPQSVQGFLTSTKLLSSKMKHKPKLNKTLNQFDKSSTGQNETIPISSPKRSRESYKKQNQQKTYTNMFEAEPSGLASSRDEKLKYSRYAQNQKEVKEKNLIHRNIIIPKTKNDHLNASNAEPVSNPNSQRLGSSRARSIPQQILDSQLPNKRHQQQQNKAEIYKPTPRNYHSRQQQSEIKIKKNPEIAYLHAKQLLSNLEKIKHELEKEISQLQHLLNKSQQYSKNMEQQYLLIKDRILTYTSNVLDAAYKQYLQNLPNWIKYENIEQTAWHKLKEVNLTIEQAKLNVGRITTDGNTPMKPIEVEKLLESYRFLVTEVADARQQCYSMRPLLSEDKILKLQRALVEVAKF